MFLSRPLFRRTSSAVTTERRDNSMHFRPNPTTGGYDASREVVLVGGGVDDDSTILDASVYTSGTKVNRSSVNVCCSVRPTEVKRSSSSIHNSASKYFPRFFVSTDRDSVPAPPPLTHSFSTSVASPVSQQDFYANRYDDESRYRSPAAAYQELKYASDDLSTTERAVAPSVLSSQQAAASSPQVPRTPPPPAPKSKARKKLHKLVDNSRYPQRELSIDGPIDLDALQPSSEDQSKNDGASSPSNSEVLGVGGKKEWTITEGQTTEVVLAPSPKGSTGSQEYSFSVFNPSDSSNNSIEQPTSKYGRSPSPGALLLTAQHLQRHDDKTKDRPIERRETSLEHAIRIKREKRMRRKDELKKLEEALVHLEAKRCSPGEPSKHVAKPKSSFDTGDRDILDELRERHSPEHHRESEFSFTSLQEMERQGRTEETARRKAVTSPSSSKRRIWNPFRRTTSSKQSKKKQEKWRKKERKKVLEAQEEKDRIEQMESARIQKLKERFLERQRRRERDPFYSPMKPKNAAESTLFIQSFEQQLFSTGMDNISFQDSLSYSNNISIPADESSFERPRMPLCVVCLEQERTHIAIPCMHFLFCQSCAETMRRRENPTCPLCGGEHVVFSHVKT